MASTATEIPVRLRAVARTLRQRRRMRLLIRAIWLALLIWSLGLVATLVGFRLPSAILLNVALATFVIGALYAWFSHPSLTRLAAGLDGHYQLSQQLATALEVARHAPSNQVEQRLIDETDTLLVRMRRYFAQQPLVPWREVETLVAVALLALGLTIAAGPLLPEADSPVALPVLPPPQAPTTVAQPTPTNQPVNTAEQPQLSPQGQAAADAIADALRDNGATRSAAESLDRGDTAGAARELRELADQADQLSEQARRDIAEGLRDAADQLREDQPGLADQLERQADALERGGQETEQALEDLARTVEQLDEAGQQAAENDQPGDQQGQQGQQGDQQQGDQPGGGQPGAQPGAGTGDQLGGEERGAQGGGAEAQGENLPLPQPSNANGPTTNATGPKGPTIQLEAGGTGETRQGGGGNGDQPLAGEADPLAIPSEYRDVVEDYFSPEP